MKYLFTLLAVILITSFAAGQGVSINQTGTDPDPSAMLDVSSTTQGMLIPRMTGAQRLAIAAPANGLLVFDLTSGSFWFRTAGQWVELTDRLHGLRDADNDTKVQVEESVDEDVIRFDIGGEEVLIIRESPNDATRLDMGVDESLIMGRNAGINSFPAQNTFIGYGAGQSNHTGQQNVNLGYQAGRNNILGSRNTMIGYAAGVENTVSNNTFIGYRSGEANGTGDNNSFLGHESGVKNTSGLRNSFLGSQAGYSNLDGSENTFVGSTAGYNNLTGANNTFIGVGAGQLNKTGANNIAIGHSAAHSLLANKDLGEGNIIMGYEAGNNLSGGDDNVIAGTRSALNLTTGHLNIYIGKEAGRQATGGNANIGIGADALRISYNSHHNVAVGDSALRANLNSHNVAVGSKSGQFATGYFNTFVGGNSGSGVTTGNENVFVGANTGPTFDAHAVTLVGANAKIQNPEGSIFGATAIGQNSIVSRSNTVILGASGTRVGIGTSLPDAKLHINGGVANEALQVDVNGASKFYVSGQGRVHVTDSMTIDGKMRIGNIHAGSRDLAVKGGAYFDDVVLIGALQPADDHKLTVDGKIACEEIRVQDSDDWPDYVFADDYAMMPLREVKAFILREQHLPGIPSATEVAATGIDIGDMQKRLLEKIEELTLHVIRLESEIDALKANHR